MIGKEIIVRRKRMSLTQRELARLINVKSTTMHQYEVGLRKIPLEALGNIAKILQCSPEDLAFEDLDQIAKEKVITSMRDQKVITGYYRAVRERR